MLFFLIAQLAMRPVHYATDTRAVLFCLRTGLQDKFIAGSFELQVLFAANKGDDTEDQNY